MVALTARAEVDTASPTGPACTMLAIPRTAMQSDANCILVLWCLFAKSELF